MQMFSEAYNCAMSKHEERISNKTQCLQGSKEKSKEKPQIF